MPGHWQRSARLPARDADTGAMEHREVRWPSRLRLEVVLVPAVAAWSALAVGCGPDRASWVSQNERLLAELPTFPQSERIRSRTQNLPDTKTLFGGDTSERTVGYTTSAKFEVPAGVTADEVITFFVQHLRSEWRVTRWQVGGQPFACFDRGRAVAWIDTNGLPIVGDRRPGAFDITVDHDAGDSDGCRG